jgi:predicted dehydrogenase
MVPHRVRTALIGCGQIADAHLQELRRVPSATVVAVCDLHMDLARQAATRFAVPLAFDDVSSMLEETRPDVVHITTPPHSHRALAMQCLAARAHVYVEKPFTVDGAEAADVISAAETRGLRVCLGHDQLFDPAWRECGQRVAAGEIGTVVHVEALQAYDLGGPFGRLLQDEPAHWVHQLPGGLFQNVMSHALARVLAFMPDQSPAVWARWFTHPGGPWFPTELRVLLAGRSCTGSLTFSTRVRPLRRATRVLGTRGALDVDLDARSVTLDRTAALPGALAKVETTWRRFTLARRNLAVNLARLGRSDLHYFQGMHTIFSAFHDAILSGGPAPVTHEDALQATRVMDAVFQSCRHAPDVAAADLQIPAAGVPR